MRLLYVTDRISLRGGADQHLLQVIGAAAGAGASVTVAAARRDPEVPTLPDGVAFAPSRGLGSAVASGARLGALEALLRRADVIHAQNVMNPTALALVTATGRAVVTVQDHRVFCPGLGKTVPSSGARCAEPMSAAACAACLPEPGYRDRLLALTAARRDALRGARLLVLSRYMQAELEAAGLGGAEVLPPWVEASREPRGPGDCFVAGGRLVKHKGVGDALLAHRRARAGLPLVIAGEGPLEGTLGGAVKLGWLGPDELRRRLRGARALLFPALWQEPFGILGVEALAQGTPVIAAASGGVAAWSNAGCLVVPRGDVAAMAAAIRRLDGDPDLARRLGEAGREAVAQRFSRAAIEARLLRVYDDVARGGARARAEARNCASGVACGYDGGRSVG